MHVVKILTGDLRIGLREGAWSKKRSRARSMRRSMT